MEETLTGKYYHKKTLCGLVLMVEVSRKEYRSSLVVMVNVIRYRKAKEEDLKELKF